MIHLQVGLSLSGSRAVMMVSKVEMESTNTEVPGESGCWRIKWRAMLTVSRGVGDGVLFNQQ